jgi:hypothetical protein
MKKEGLSNAGLSLQHVPNSSKGDFRFGQNKLFTSVAYPPADWAFKQEIPNLAKDHTH